MAQFNNIKHSFPKQYSQSVSRVETILANRHLYKHSLYHADSVFWKGEMLQLFARQYAEPKNSLPNANLLEQVIFDRIYTRHHDGFVRQAHLQALLHDDFAPFADIITPFVLQLLGEYVLEIGLDCDKFIRKYPNEIRYFIVQNPKFWFKQKQRITSYWNEYYRHVYPNSKNFYPNFKNYPLYQTIDFIETLIKNDQL